MTIPGGIRVKLSLALLVIVGSALFAAYVIIVPSLERRLVAAKLDQQQSDAEILAINFAAQVAQNNLALRRFRRRRGLRLQLASRPLRRRAALRDRATLLSLADSSASGGSEIEERPDCARGGAER